MPVCSAIRAKACIENGRHGMGTAAIVDEISRLASLLSG